MQVNKILGLSLFGLGVIVSAVSYNSIRTLFGLTFPATYDNYIFILGVALVLGGAFFAFRGGSSTKKGEEVPIYEGEGRNRKIVGYRRH